MSTQPPGWAEDAEGKRTSRTRELAREDPEAVRSFARRVGEPLRSRLLEIVEEEEP